MRADLGKTFENTKWHLDSRAESRSGDGSTKAYTKKLRTELAGLLYKYNVQTFLDAPCGDWNWMQLVDLQGVSYIGMDIVEEIVDENTAQFSAPNVKFMLGDITATPLPQADMIMVRDCLFHLKHFFALEFFKNFYASGIPLLLTTSYVSGENKEVAQNGMFSPINLQAAPFRFPEPMEFIDDTPDTGNYRQRGMGLWHRDTVKAFIDRVKVV